MSNFNLGALYKIPSILEITQNAIYCHCLNLVTSRSQSISIYQFCHHHPHSRCFRRVGNVPSHGVGMHHHWIMATFEDNYSGIGCVYVFTTWLLSNRDLMKVRNPNGQFHFCSKWKHYSNGLSASMISEEELDTMIHFSVRNGRSKKKAIDFDRLLHWNTKICNGRSPQVKVENHI